MGELNLGGIKVADAGGGQVNLPLAIAGGAGAGIVLGLVYGLVGKIIGIEFSYAAFVVGAVAGIAALKLGKGRSIVSGIVAALATLIGILLGKMFFLMPEIPPAMPMMPGMPVPPPVGPSFFDLHFTMFDILFCYIAPPAVAFFAAGTEQARDILKRIPGLG